jgi:hypothetical protein
MVTALEIADDSLKLLEKAATEADALEGLARSLHIENNSLKEQNALLSKQASASTKLDRSLLLKVAGILEQEGMLASGMDADKLASLYEADPNRLADVALRLLCPASAEGKSVKTASAAVNSPGSPKSVLFNGHEVIDHDGWLNALK